MPYKDPEKQKRSQRLSKRRRRKLRYDVVEEYKLTYACKVCGYNRCAQALDFHHLGDKEEAISLMIQKCRPLEKIVAEMAKCEVLCANCHRELHATGH